MTTLIAYEFSPTLPDQGKHHRNIIFRSNIVPDRSISSFDVPNAIELWKGLEANCDKADGCDFPDHTPQPEQGLGADLSALHWDGQQYSGMTGACDKSEPLTEIFQIKGSQECAGRGCHG